MNGLETAHRLMGLMVAKRETIKPEQVEAFMQNPDVIIPDGAVEIISVLSQFPGPHPNWLRYIPGGLLLDEGDPISLVYNISTGQIHLFSRRNKIVDLGVFKEYGYLTHDAEIRLLSMINGQPLWATSSTHKYSDDKTQTWTLYLGKKKIISLSDISHSELGANHLLIAYSNRQKKAYLITLPIVKKKVSVKKFVLKTVGDRAITFFREIDEALWVGTEKNIASVNAIYSGSGRPVDLIGNGQNSKIVVVVEKGKLYLGDLDVGECSWWSHRVMPYNGHQYAVIGDMPYSHGVCFYDEKWAYVAMARHQQRCWVIDGQEQVAFNWVSDFFQHPEHGRCYWGMTHGHLVLMKL